MSMNGLFGIGTSALGAFQRALDTTAHNIANANTEGYSRQQVNFVSRQPQYVGVGFIGTGVDVEGIDRIYDQFLEDQLQSYTASSRELEVFHQYATQIDNLLADPDAGLGPAMDRFTSALQDLSVDPTSSAARQVVLSEGQALVDRFHDLDGWLAGMSAQVDDGLERSVADVNRLTQAIADINEKIVLAEGVAREVPPNDLLDQRDTLVRELSQYLSVTTQLQDDGALNVTAGSGQALVIGTQVTELVAYRGEGIDAPVEVGLRAGNGGVVPIGDRLTGGEIGGLLSFREQMLDPTRNELGRIALAVGDQINQQHQKGMDLQGNLGGPLFDLGEPQWDAYAGTTSEIDLALDDVGQLTNASYRLQFDGSSWSLSRLDTGAQVAMSGSGTAADPFLADGLRITVDGAANAGDTFLLEPTRAGARSLEQLIDDPSLLAAASPVLAQAAPTNGGSATIEPGTVTDITNPAFQDAPGALTPPLLIRFDSETSYQLFDNSDPAAPVLLESVSGYDPVRGADLFPTPGGLDYGYQVRISGAALAGDQFTIDYNSDGVGDNRNAQALAGVFDLDSLSGGTESIEDAYRGLVADTGSATRRAELAAGAQSRLLDRALSERDAYSGVNLDEEAANLVRYQQAYQAAAQVVSVANDMFRTLLEATRG